MADETFRLAMAQILIEGGRPEENLERACRAIEESAARGAEVVVLPECLDLGWTWPDCARQAEPVPGPRSERLAEAARQAGVYVCAGLVERDGDRFYNAAVLIAPDGEILRKHRKINELTIAHDLYATGDSLAVTPTPLGTLGVAICADNFPTSLSLGHSLGRMGCRVLLSPCAWAVDGDHDPERQPYGGIWMESYTSLAKLYGMTVIGVSNVGWLTAGPWKGRKCIGCSLAVGPGGEVLAKGPYGDDAESLLIVEIERGGLPLARGTAIAERLRQEGYEGP